MTTTIIIQARMSSTRLPGKVMKELTSKPMLTHVIERCRLVRRADQVVVATTTGSEDDVIAELCRDLATPCFRGSRDNVLERYYEAAKLFKADVVVRITSDCPLIDPTIIDQCLEAFERGDYDYISNVVPGERTFPRGLDTEIFKFSALKQANEKAVEEYEREHVTPRIWQNKDGNLKIGPMVMALPEYQADYRLVVDYPEDFALVENIYNYFYHDGSIIKVPEVIKYLNTHPEVAVLNAHCEQKPLQ